MTSEWNLASAIGAFGAVFLWCAPVAACAQGAAPCVTSVVLKDCPDRQAAPFQLEADRSDTNERQQMQDLFAASEQQRQWRAAHADSELDRATVYGRQQGPSKPALLEFGQTVSRSGPKDCRTAYSMSGTGNRFGVYDLIHDTFTGAPCSWK